MIPAMPLILNLSNSPNRHKSATQPCDLSRAQSRDTYLCRHRIRVETLRVDSSPYLSPLAAPASAALSSLAPRVFRSSDPESVLPGIPALDSLLVAVPAASRCTVRPSHTKAAAPKLNLVLPL